MTVHTSRIPGAASGPDMSRLLARLSRKGAHILRRRVADDEHFCLLLPGHPASRSKDADTRVDPRLVSYALTAGWLSTEDDGRRLRLTEAGALALRRGLAPMQPSPTAATGLEAARPAAPARKPSGGSASTLERLQRQRDSLGQPLVSSLGAQAGRRLGNDFLLGQMMPRVTANWDKAALGERPRGAAPRRGVELGDRVSDAQRRVRRALDDAGPDLAGLLIDICCLDRGLEEVERERQWPARTARVVLDIALKRLARHYGMIASGPPRAQDTAHWGTEDYRPSLDAWAERAPTGAAKDAPRDAG
jgi:hypothetical protein